MPSEENVEPPGSPSAPQPSPAIPDHELLRLIGRGAYGEVWLARNAIGTLRAVKIVHRQSFGRAEHFEREFNGLLKFEPVSRSHGGLVHVLQIGRRDDAGYFFYVMELADAVRPRGEDGGLRMEDSNNGQPLLGQPPSSILDPQNYTPCTLRSELQPRGSLPTTECVALGLKLAAALEHLHANGLVHRDIKPSNIIFVNGEPKLADIGLVTAIDEAQSLVGTAGYIPPEGPGTPQADLYSLGKVLYEIAFGKDRQEFPQLPPDLQSHPDYAALLEINEVILKACETDPHQRYQSAEAISDDLKLLSVGKSVKQKRTQQQLLAVAKKVLFAAVVFGVVAIGVNFFLRHSPATRPSTTNAKARAFYNRAVQDLKSKAPDGGQRAYANLAEAVKADPRFLDAYYLMFETGFHGNVVPGGNDRIAMKLAELDPDSAQFHTVNSLIKFDEWSFDDAISEAKRAIKINPNLMRTHGLYGWYLELARGDAEAARQEYKKAEQIGPPDTIIQTIMAGSYCMERKFDLAIKQLSKAIQQDPNAIEPHEFLSEVYEADKQYDKAIDDHEAWKLLSGEDPEYTRTWHKNMRSILHEKGPRGWWQAQLDGQTNNLIFEPYWVAGINARLGKTNEVFSFLNLAYTNHNYNMINLLEDDHWDGYRNDPRFKELLDKMGFHLIPGVVR